MIQLLLGALLLLQAVAPQQTQQRSPGINFFSLAQDIEIGSESAKEAESILPLIRVPHLDSYVRSVGARLVRTGRLPAFQYRFRLVNSTSVNAVTFPGGAIYVHRGLVELTETEHELAAVLAHEIAHAAARHGTGQLSLQLLVQGPTALAAIMAGLPADRDWKDQLARFGVSLGARASFLRYSPEQELEANTLALDILSRANYSPTSLPAILARIHQSVSTELSPLPVYVYNHPQSSEATTRLQTEIEDLNATPRVTPPDAAFRNFRTALMRLALPVDQPAEVQPPDTLLTNQYVHPREFYRLEYPEGWQVSPTGADGAMIAPLGGIQPSREGDDLKIGVMFDLFDISERAMTLEDATNRLIIFLRQRNQSLRVIPGAQAQMLISAEPALRTVMIGRSSSAEPAEIVWVVTRIYYQTLFYIICVAPEEEFPTTYQPIFEQVIRSVELR